MEPARMDDAGTVQYEPDYDANEFTVTAYD